jgi:hypothetical protein
VSDIKASAETHDGQFDGVNPGPWDDGWWIDDVRISETLSDPADITLDDKIVRHCAGDDTVGCIVDQDCVDAGTTGPCEGLAPQCPGTCTTLTVGIETEPDLTGGPLDELLSAPGQPIELDASSSTGTCLGGSLLYRFSVVGGDVLREYSENPVFVDAPSVDTDYRVDVSCSADAAGLCDNFAVVDVNVNCPSTGNVSLGVFPVIQATSKNPLTGSATWGWTPSKSYLLHVGNLPVTPAYAGTQTAGSGTSFTHAPVGNFYYLVREVGPFCNASGLWTSGGTGEQPGRDTTLP